jgi:tetratricopeptide (TPR) repeat protein
MGKRGRFQFRLSQVLAALGVLLAACVALAAYQEIRKARYGSRLPTVPTFSHEPPAMRAYLEAADRAARAAPTSASAVGALGLAYHANMFYAEADRAYAVAEELSGRPWAYYRALVHEARGDPDDVAVALRRVVAEAPDFSPAWWRLGEAEFKLGRRDAAIAAWERARVLPEPAPPPAPPDAPARRAAAPVSAYAGLGMARALLAGGDPARAAVVLEEVMTAAPAFGPGLRLLSTAYAALGRRDDAERTARRADRLPGYDPYIDPTFVLLARESRSPTFLLQQAASADAGTNGAWREYLIRRALELDPANTDALEELGALLRALRRFDEALDILQRLDKLAADDPRVAGDIGRCFSGLRRYGEAESYFRRALERLDDANNRYDLGLVLDRTGRPAEAMREYRLALARNPTHRDALNNLGIAFARAGRLNDAAAYFERLVAADPANPDAHANLGAILLSVGEPDRAAQSFRAALEIDPGHAVARDALEKIKFPKTPADSRGSDPSVR